MTLHLRLVSLLIVLITVPPAIAETSRMSAWIGIWQAVDPEDGSLQTLSITRTSPNSAVVLIHDSHFTLCNGDLGLGQGNGNLINPRQLDVPDYKVTCFHSGLTKGGGTSFTLERDGALRRTLAPPSPGITYYRIGR